jgi:hypothetical protein
MTDVDRVAAATLDLLREWAKAERGTHIANVAEKLHAFAEAVAGSDGQPTVEPPPPSLLDRVIETLRGDDDAATGTLVEHLKTILDRYDRRTGSIQWAVENACVEARQYRESASHHRQIADHYKAALAALLAQMTEDPLHDYLHHVSREAVAAARVALSTPPEWDGTLIA